MSLKDKKFEILYDHYKDTFVYLREYLKQREKFFFFLLAIIFLQFIQISFNNEVNLAINSFVEKKVGLNFNFNNLFINNALWFVLFSLCLRYFQINILINKQYEYLHSIETKICSYSGENDYISREGNSYFKNYPIFSDWANFIYTWFFPIILIIANVLKIQRELITLNETSFASIVSLILFLAVLLNTVFYLIAIHYKKKE